MTVFAVPPTSVGCPAGVLAVYAIETTIRLHGDASTQPVGGEAAVTALDEMHARAVTANLSDFMTYPQ